MFGLIFHFVIPFDIIWFVHIPVEKPYEDKVRYFFLGKLISISPFLIS